jgi:uncharacterized caspase-like protein
LGSVLLPNRPTILDRLAVALVLLLAAWPAWGEQRAALLIGNANYAHANPLANPIRDVELLAETLSAEPLGFEVEVHTDLTRSEFAQVVSEFLARTRSADLTLFFYAGHGLQYEGENYLLGTEARLATEFDLASETISLN